MSEDIGSALPPPLRFELGAHPTGDAAQAVLLLTTDADGHSRTAVLAAAEIYVRDASHIGLRLHTRSNASANVKRSGQAALWCVLDAAAYCIRGTVARAPAKGTDPELESFELTITSVLRDFQPDSPMVSGPTYKRLQ
ncbi:MAG TPA: hypothetical protein VGW96_01215 [Candidatus Eremiobacteraceae bacterium]|jgi:hypothetical protein|nr:hypothetical protein [Candidatus Eremiobacteraceae bacterium]